jgi:HEAT repeat protein
LTFANFRLRLRGLVYRARVSEERLLKTTDRVLGFLVESTSEESTYHVPVARSLAGIDRHYAQMVINRIVSLLEDENYRERWPAMAMLKRIGRVGRISSDKAVNILINLLSNEDQFVRRGAAETLGYFGGQKAVNALIKVLNCDEESFVRGSAAEALGQIGDEQAVGDLIEAFRNIEAGYRWHMENALAALGNEQVVDYLIEALREKNRDVRLHAATTLGRIGNEKAVDPLIEALKDDGYSPFHAAEALIKIGNEKAVDATVKALNSQSGEVRQQIAEALGKSENGNAVDALVEALISEDQYAAYRSAEMLVKIGNEKAVDAMIKALNSRDSDMRRRAARALGLLRNEKAIDPLITTLSDEDKDVRKSAVEALCMVGTEKAVYPLMKALGVEDREVRINVVMALGRIGGDQAVDALMIALNDRDEGVRERAARELGGLGNEKGLDILIEVLREAHVRMSSKHSRLLVEDVLGQIGSEKAVNALIDALDSEDSIARSHSAKALGQLRDEKAICALIKALGSKDSHVRLEAARALVIFNGNDLSKALQKSLRSEDSFVRHKAAKTIGYYSLEPRVSEELARIAASDPVGEIRTAAAEAKERFARKLKLFGHFIPEGTAQNLSDNESRELFLIGEAFKVVAEAGHIFRPTPNSDWGIDGEIEFKNVKGEASGQRVYLQLKSGGSYLRTRGTDGKEIFTIKNPRHSEYWQSHAYPVLLVIRDYGGQIRWMNVTEYLRHHGTNTKQIEFQGEPFTAESVKQMRARFA